MDFLAQLIVWINGPINGFFGAVFAFVSDVPGWLSNTVISAVVGVLLLVIFKYTSNQSAIGRVRDGIKANMLALKLFKDSMAVTVQSQLRVFGGAFSLLFHAVRPMMVMIIPVSLILAQMGMWYQFRPLKMAEETLVTVQLNGDVDSAWPSASVRPADAIEITDGPVRIFSKRQVCWKIKALKKGYHHISFEVDRQPIEKELAVGDDFMRISPRRPSWHWSEILMYPLEKPFEADSVVQSITIDYPERVSWTCGTDWWLIYFFAASMVFAFIFKPLLKVRI